MAREITIYDIAEELQVSPATVSRGLRNDSSISEATRKRIIDLAARRGYRSNNFASNLRKQKTNTIGVIIPKLNSNLLTSALAGIEQVATKSGYDLIIGHSAEAQAVEKSTANNFFHKRVDGLIVSLASNTKNLQHFKPFEKLGIPIVFFDRVDKASPGTKVIIDNFNAGYQATEHLIAQGCKKIVHVTTNLKRNVFADRLKGYQAALIKKKLHIMDPIILEKMDEAGGLEAAKLILQMEPLPDAVFVSNDLCAVICMKTLKDNGIKVPSQMAFVGFNNDIICRIVEPNLTSINYPGFEMGQVVAKNLIDQLLKKTTDFTTTVIIDSKLVIRESSIRKKVA